jgi:DNA polymerase-1
MFWRKRYINGINDLNKIVKSSAEREATNMPIQWTSADIIKIAMIQVHKYMLNHKLKSKMIMQVHDELVFDVFPWEEVELKREVQKIMQNIIKDSQIELKVDIWEWNTWKEAK